MNFAHTACVTDIGVIKAGDVIRPKADVISPWADCLVLGFSAKDKYGDVYVKLARPYAYASCVGTTGATVLQGVEVFEVTVSKLREDRVVSGCSNFCTSSVEPGLHDAIDARSIR